MKKSPLRRSKKSVSFQQKQKQQLMLGVGFYAVLVLIAAMGKLSWSIVGWYALIGAVTYLVYAKDKEAAQKGTWRTPESTLHLLSILGGWVGAMMAQNYLRHKTKKPEFRLAYYLTVLVNLAVLLYLISGGDLSQF